MTSIPTPATTTPPTGFRYGKWLFALGILGLLGWIGVRVSGAMQSRTAVAEQREQVARKATAEARGPRLVSTVRGAAATVTPKVVFEGTLAPLQETDIGFKVGGRLSAVRVKVGSTVKAGQVLASLDAAEAAAQVRAAEAALRAAEAQLTLATDSATRTAKVVEAGAQPEAFAVQATQQQALTAAQKDSAAAQLLLARQALGNHTLIAPFAGTVTRAPDAAGGVVSPGVALFHLADFSKLKLVGSVSANDVSLVRVGAPVELQSNGNQVARGMVTALVSELDDKTKRVPVHAEISNEPGSGLIAGSLVRATISGDTPIDVVKLPHSVLKPGSQDELFVIEGDRLDLRHVDFSVAPDGSLLVRRGVSAHEAVLKEPWPEAQAGDAVKVQP